MILFVKQNRGILFLRSQVLGFLVKVLVNGVWRTSNFALVAINGTWKSVTSLYTIVEGNWQKNNGA